MSFSDFVTERKGRPQNTTHGICDSPREVSELVHAQASGLSRFGMLAKARRFTRFNWLVQKPEITRSERLLTRLPRRTYAIEVRLRRAIVGLVIEYCSKADFGLLELFQL